MTSQAVTQQSLNILKQAILLERRGYEFYKKVADQAENPQVQAFFNDLAQEELAHIKILSAQFKAFNKNGHFDVNLFEDQEDCKICKEVLDQEIKNKIAAASFEASAITVAISMEKRAVDLYSKQAKEAQDIEEKKMYAWLADFERGHLKNLMAIDQDLHDSVWEDNNFWPF